MKKLLSIIASLFLLSGAVIAQAPGLFNYQGVARNSVGNILKNQSISLRLSVRDGAPNGPVVYQETRTTLTNPFGLFNVQIGGPGAGSVTGTIAGVNWSVGAKHVQVEIDPNGGSSFINIGTAQLASVPYSLFATTSGDIVLPFNKTQSDAGTLFKVTNSGTGAGSTALEGLTNSTAGNAAAVIGTVTSTTPGGFSAGVRGINNGTGGLGIGVWGSQNGSGWGVYGTANGGIGVNGSANSGIGVNGTSNTGTGGRFTTSSGLALHTTGGVRLQGIGETDNFILKSDGSGNANWVAPSAVGIVSGTGTINFVPKWTPSGTNLGNSLLFDNGTSMGIGTTTPTHRLDVSHTGSTGIGVNSSSGFSVVDINAASGDAALRFGNAGVNQWNIRNQPGTDNLQIFELGGGGERMSIQNTTGNIAIGGSPGNYRVDILHPGSTGILNRSSAGFSVVDIDAFSGDAALRFANNGVNQWNMRNQPGTDNLQIFELGGGGERMHIQNSTGNISIGGEPSPVYRLDVLHPGSTGARIRSAASFSVVDIDANSGDAALRFIKAGANQWNIRNRPSDDYLEIFELGGGGSRVVIQDATGNVGIGETTAPIYKLDVLHAGSTGARIRSSASFSVVDIDANSGDAALRFIKAGANQWNMRNRPSDDYFEIFELGGGGSRVVIQDATGNFGIGETTSPIYRLDVLHPGSTGARIRSAASFSVVDIDANSGDAALRFIKAGANQWNIRNNPGTDDLQIFELGGGGERMRIENTTGRVVVDGDLHVAGTLSKAAGAFKIDHPQDPENKYLVHSFVESPEMMNIYNGNITTNASGKAVVTLPDYFNTLNKDFRYQLTVIGSFAQAIISKEVNGNSFEIATNQPNVKVSWQVTGVRQDPWANKFRIQNVVEKAAKDKGQYLNPEAYNLPQTRKIGYSPEPTESSLTHNPKADANKVAPPVTGGSLDYKPEAPANSKPAETKGTSVEDVPAAKQTTKPAPETKGTSVEDVPAKKAETKPATKTAETKSSTDN